MSIGFYYPLFVAAVLVGMALSERGCPDPVLARRCYLVGILGGLLGARSWYALQYSDFSQQGMSLFGFGLGAGIAVTVYHYWQHGGWTPTEFPDAVAPGFALGVGVLRIGCFFRGCCFGKASELPWAVQYRPDQTAFVKQAAVGQLSLDAESSLPVHPVQLYESLFALAAFGILVWLPRSKVRLVRYELFMIWCLGYSIFRFFIEFVRGDSGPLTLV